MSVTFWLLASVFVVAVLVLEGVLVYWRDRKWRELEASFRTSGTGWRMTAPEAGAKVKRPVGEIKVLEARTTRLGYLVALASWLAVGLVQFLNIIPWLKYALQMLLTLFSFTAIFILLRLWRGMDDERRRTIMDQLHLAWERQERLATRSLRDELTGLYNRKFFALRLGQEVKRQIRHGGFISCVIFEIASLSDFRHIYGAQERDRLLQRAGRLLEQNVRAEDVVCRYGEAQFAAALMECPQIHVDTVAGRVSNNMEKLLFDAVNRERGSALGFLAGVASFPEDGASGQELLTKGEASLRSEVRVEG